MENPQSDSKSTLHDLLTNAVDLSDGHIGYTNTVVINANQIEVFVNLYFVSPQADNTLQAQRVYKFVMPIAVAENFAEVLNNVLLDQKTKLQASNESSE
jgi:hypothetical protein